MPALITHHLRHQWAVLRGDPIAALTHMEAIVALNLQALNTAVGAVTDQLTAAQSAIAAAQAAEATDQATVDALTAKLAAVLPAPAPTPAPAIAVEDAATANA